MTVIDIGTRDTRRVIIGGAVSGALGIAALVGSVSAFADGEPVGGIIAGLIGVALTGIAVLAIVNWKKVSRPRKLIIEAPGVRWDDPQGTPWAVAWQELGAVSVSRTQERVVQLSDALTRKTMVRLDLFPRDPQRFRATHPHMEHMWEFHTVRNGYRLPLGDAANLVPLLDNSLRHFAGPLYRGVQDEGFTVGLV
ncbi:hypothetical protein Lesp02_24380 [Lentzea sp. NBRC 105346]|uniref:hypothetical protein n=1 Tax=Lentzea sp. NBRC 105346 TaxID=3032205 RepID=UPI00249FE068|nr:hypothetical protein [Lentzea sp. NBRC 105346]GLZ30248.1 hypothetical protein Lesp02_24380 [Lentzea sp. NBRC 105346]